MRRGLFSQLPPVGLSLKFELKKKENEKLVTFGEK